MRSTARQATGCESVQCGERAPKKSGAQSSDRAREGENAVERNGRYVEYSEKFASQSERNRQEATAAAATPTDNKYPSSARQRCCEFSVQTVRAQQTNPSRKNPYTLVQRARTHTRARSRGSRCTRSERFGDCAPTRSGAEARSGRAHTRTKIRDQHNCSAIVFDLV